MTSLVSPRVASALVARLLLFLIIFFPDVSDGSAHFKSSAPVVTHSRRLVGFKSIEQAARDGELHPLRVEFFFDLLRPDNPTLLASNQMCSSALPLCPGSASTRCAAPDQLGYGADAAWLRDGVACEPEEYISADHVARVKTRMTWVADFLQRTFMIRRPAGWRGVDIADVLRVHGYSTSPGSETFYPDADLVVYVTMHPNANKLIAGYAQCQERESLQDPTPHRCTVGQFNWCPSKQTFDVRHTDGAAVSVVRSELHTALHEMMHVLGCCRPTDGQFLGPDGVPVPEEKQRGLLYRDILRTWSLVEDGPGPAAAPRPAYVQRMVRHVVTPRVVAVAREQFNCSDLEGVPLEDDTVGFGAHWESRVLGSELMSYGEKSGEPYLSDLTLALLEDTRQYKVNYASAGSVGPTHELRGADGGEQSPPAGVPRRLVTAVNNRTDRLLLSPGYLRWGRWQGCDFVRAVDIWHLTRSDVSAPFAVTSGMAPFVPPTKEVIFSRSNGATWPDKARYTCSDPNLEHKAYDTMCSADNRATAMCAPKLYASLPAVYACMARGHCEPRNPLAPLGFPPEFQHVPGQPLKAGATFAMDAIMYPFAVRSCTSEPEAGPMNRGMPVMVGDANTTRHKEDGSNGPVKGWTLQNEWERFAGVRTVVGGQAYCATCRCFQSSLVPYISLGFQKIVGHRGRCHLSNCFSPGYLQFGLHDPVAEAASWFPCPPGGGAVYIPGYVGLFHCPLATDFCRYENVTGIFKVEHDLTSEWVAFALIALACLGLFPTCCCWTRGRRYMTSRMSLVCGIEVHGKRRDAFLAGFLNDGHNSRSRDSRRLLLINLSVFWIAVGSLGVAVLQPNTTGWLLLTASSFVGSGVSILGLATAYHDNPCLVGLFYFYACAGGAVCELIVLIVSLAHPQQVATVMIAGGKRDDDKTGSTMYPTLVSVASSLLFGVTLLALRSAARILTLRNLAFNVVVVGNAVTFAFSCWLLDWGARSRRAPINASASAALLAEGLSPIAIVNGAFLLLSAASGIAAARLRDRVTLYGNAGLHVVTAVVLVASASVVFASQNLSSKDEFHARLGALNATLSDREWLAKRLSFVFLRLQPPPSRAALAVLTDGDVAQRFAAFASLTGGSFIITAILELMLTLGAGGAERLRKRMAAEAEAAAIEVDNFKEKQKSLLELHRNSAEATSASLGLHTFGLRRSWFNLLSNESSTPGDLAAAQNGIRMSSIGGTHSKVLGPDRQTAEDAVLTTTTLHIRPSWVFQQDDGTSLSREKTTTALRRHSSAFGRSAAASRTTGPIPFKLNEPEMRDFLTIFYTRVNKSKLNIVPMLIKKYRHKQRRLWVQLRVRYGSLFVPPVIDTEYSMTRPLLYAFLVNFFRRVQPEKAGRIAPLVRKFYARQPALWALLRAQFADFHVPSTETEAAQYFLARHETAARRNKEASVTLPSPRGTTTEVAMPSEDLTLAREESFPRLGRSVESEEKEGDDDGLRAFLSKLYATVPDTEAVPGSDPDVLTGLRARGEPPGYEWLAPGVSVFHVLHGLGSVVSVRAIRSPFGGGVQMRFVLVKFASGPTHRYTGHSFRRLCRVDAATGVPRAWEVGAARASLDEGTYTPPRLLGGVAGVASGDGERVLAQEKKKMVAPLPQVTPASLEAFFAAQGQPALIPTIPSLLAAHEAHDLIRSLFAKYGAAPDVTYTPPPAEASSAMNLLRVRVQSCLAFFHLARVLLCAPCAERTAADLPATAPRRGSMHRYLLRQFSSVSLRSRSEPSAPAASRSEAISSVLKAFQGHPRALWIVLVARFGEAAVESAWLGNLGASFSTEDKKDDGGSNGFLSPATPLCVVQVQSSVKDIRTESAPAPSPAKASPSRSEQVLQAENGEDDTTG